MPAFVELARKIVKHRAAIDHALDSGLSNALIESTDSVRVPAAHPGTGPRLL